MLYVRDALITLLYECLIVADLPVQLDSFLLLLLPLLLQQRCLLAVLRFLIACSVENALIELPSPRIT